MIRRLMLAVVSVLMLQDVVVAQKEEAARQRLHNGNQPLPTLAQCRADLSAWMKDRSRGLQSKGKIGRELRILAGIRS